MNEKRNVHEEVEKTLEWLGREERIKSDPYFFTRLQARIRAMEDSGPKKAFAVLLRPAVLPW